MNIRHNVDLQAFNTFGLAVKATNFAAINSEDELEKLVLSGKLRDSKWMILGGGSNLLFTRDFDGMILSMNIKGKNVVEETADELVLEGGAGENWHELVMHCVEMAWGGIENLSLIPGRLGAAPIQNIGAYGVELKDVFAYLDAMDMETGEVRRYQAEDCRFGYRDSVFKQELKGKVAILRVALRLRKQNHQIQVSYGAITAELKEMGVAEPGIGEVSQAVMNIRRSKLPDPAEIGNSGSFFKNPEVPTAFFESLKERFPDLPGYVISDTVTKIPAAWLIDRAGWKGKRFGNYGVHDKQALVLVNHGGANGSDIYALSTKILDSVKEIYGVELEREVNVI
jgi:UDP-N-acetylmuramate dehydrogenase